MRFSPAAVAVALVLVLAPAFSHAGCVVTGRKFKVTIEEHSQNQWRAVIDKRIVQVMTLKSETHGVIDTKSTVDEIIADGAAGKIYRTNNALRFVNQPFLLALQGTGRFGYSLHHMYGTDHHMPEDSLVAVGTGCSALETLFGGYAIYRLSQK